MPAKFPNPSRNGLNSNIKAQVKGQKPSCKVVIYRWSSPELVGLEALNLSNAGDFFTNTEKQQQAGTAAGLIRIDNDVVKCSVHKNKNSSSGGFTLVLKRGNAGDKGQQTSSNNIDYLKLINPGDWISIYMKKDDDINIGSIGSNRADSGLKMLGIIENVRFVEIDDPSAGTPRLEYVVTGRDFGKIFENEIYYNPVISRIPNLQNILGVSFLQDAEAQMGNKQNAFLSADEVFKNMIDFYLGGSSNSVASTNKSWFIPQNVAAMMGQGTSGLGSKPFINILDTARVGLQQYSRGVFNSAEPLLGKTLPKALPNQGTIWAALKQYSNPILNEMIVDLTNKNGRLVPSVQLRQIPYSNKANSGPYVFNRSPNAALSSVVSNSQKTHLLDLPRHNITSVDVKQKNVGKSDFERINAIVVVPNIPQGIESKPVQQAYAMALNGPSVQRYGLRLLQGNTFYTYDTEVDFSQYVSQVTSLLSDWLMTAHLLYDGTIVTDGTDEFVEVGTNLFIEDVRQLYHIEGISYMYEIDPQTGSTIYNTEFRVSRGQLTNSNVTKSDFLGVPVELEENQGVTITTNTIENIRNLENNNSKGTSGGGGFNF